MSNSCVGENSSSSNNNSFNNNSFNNTNSFNTTVSNTTISFGHVSNVNNLSNADERAEILSWLSPLDPWIRHDDIRTQRVEHVGDWLLRTEEYQSWFDGTRGGEPDNSALFCYGDPGVGKTYITSLVIDGLCDSAKEQNAAVACLYFDFAVQNEQSPTAFLSSLLKQLVGGLENIPASIVKAFRDQKKTTGGRRLELGQVVETLRDISSSRPTFICIDAVDECLAEYRAKLLDSLQQILHRSPSMRIFLAGRLHIRDEVEKTLAGMVAAVSITPTQDDIIRFLKAKLKEDTTPEAMDKSLEEDIIKNIPERASELFLLVSLNIETILQETTLHRRREKLVAMTDGLGLGDAYGATIGRIKAQNGDRARLGVEALMWISHAERPLSVDEICHALALEIGSAEINTDNIPSIRIVLGCCLGLATIDKGSSAIRLIHFTLKEYLFRHRDSFDKPHSVIAETCLTYLNFQAIKDLPSRPSYSFKGPPFLEYASLHWGTHMRMEPSDRSRSLARYLFDQYDSHISAKLLALSISDLPSCYDKPFSALHCISYLGIAEVAIDLIKTKRWDVNERDSAGLTPLMLAAKRGHEEVVKLLLKQKDIQPDIPDTGDGRTALSWGAGSGCEGVVRLFLSRQFTNPKDIDRRWEIITQVMGVLFRRKYAHPDRPDSNGLTPLSWAAKDGRAAVVKLLLEWEGVSPDRQDKYGRTPLSWAAKNGREAVVKLLLEREGVRPDRLDKCGQTPLSLAAGGGREGVVKLLLERKDVDPNRPDDGGRTPLSWAAVNGCEGVVKLLLEQEGVSPDRPDNDGQTPLSLAARGGHKRVVKLFLERKDVDPDRPDNGGRTPLSWAAGNGYEGAVKLLLERRGVSPDRRDNDGWTPLSWAAWNRCEGVVKLLLEREDVNPDNPVSNGRTPLLWAASGGPEGLVKLFLERKDVDPDRPDNSGRTPLSWAAGNGYEGVVKLLLEREGVSPDRPDNDGQTPLSLAAKDGRGGVLKLLLEREGVRPDRLDKYGRTPLSWAAGRGHERAVKLLLERKDADPDRPDNGGRTPLSWAAGNGCEGLVKLLLEWEGVSPDRPDNDGRTPLSLAAGGGHKTVVKLLLERKDVDPDRPDNGGRTPLSWAAGIWREGVVKLLLERGGVNPDRPDNDGRTPLWWATRNRCKRAIILLLEREDVSPDRPDNCGETPLSLAARPLNFGIRELFKARKAI